MAGNDRVRFCAHCRLHVHNLSEITPTQAMELVRRSGGRLCLRIERDPGGAPRTRTHAEPLYQIRRRVSRLAAGAFGAALTLCPTAAAQTPAQEPAQQQETRDARPVVDDPVPVDGGTVVVDKVDVEIATGGLVIAVVEPSEPLVKAAMDNDLEAVRRLLLFEEADVNAVDKNLGITALAEAFENGNREIIRELLWRGARVNERLSYRQTALMRMNERTTAEVVRDLLDAGARVNLSDEDGNTALMAAAGYGHREAVELLLRAGAKVNARNKAGNTALMSAARAGATETVRALLLAGADVSPRDDDGHSALWHARDNEEEEAASLLLAFGAYEEPEAPEEKRCAVASFTPGARVKQNKSHSNP
jgi:hypothetical protein